MKRNAIIRVIGWSVTLVVLLSLLVGGLVYFLPYPKQTTEKVDATEFPAELSTDFLNYGTSAGDIREIEIDWVSGEIQIIPTEIDHIKVNETAAHANTEAMLCRKDGDTLKISFCKGELASLKGIGTKDLTIQVPKGWACRKLEIDAASPKISVQGLTADEIDLDTAGGESRFDSCTLGKLDADTASGNLYLTGTLENLEYDSASGSVEAELDNVPSKITMDTASGSLSLKLPKGAGFAVALDSLSGKLDSDFPTALDGGRYLCGDGACKIEMESMSGGVTVNQK